MTSGQEPLSMGAVNSNLPPYRNTPAIFLINLRCTWASSRKRSPPGDHSIKGLTEEIRILMLCATLNQLRFAISTEPCTR
jgi:hypothetical protein